MFHSYQSYIKNIDRIYLLNELFNNKLKIGVSVYTNEEQME